jgi:putative membrane protein
LNQNRLITVLYLIFLISFIGHIIPPVRPMMLMFTPYILFFTPAYVLFFTFRKREPNLITWCLIIYSLIFILEVTGTKSGTVFGDLRYGNILGIKISGVPLVIAFDWLIMILGAITLAGHIDQNPILRALLTGTFAVVFDIILEPVSIKLSYWNWNSGLIPLMNYYFWFGISFLASLLYDSLKIKINERLSESYFTAQLIFFGLLFVFL